jgi:asparagine synthase (glutamine-hydrolysing)
MKELSSHSVRTFSVGFEGANDETAITTKVAKSFKTKHRQISFSEEDAMRLLLESGEVFDEPYSDFGSLPSMLVSAAAREEITVALTGDGGDELFGGYTSYANLRVYRAALRIPRWLRRTALYAVSLAKRKSDLTALGKTRELLRWSLEADPKYPLISLYPGSRSWTPESIEYYKEGHLVIRRAGITDLIEQERLYDMLFGTLADNFLVKTDRSTMTHALEARNPYLDYRFIEYTLKIPSEWKTGYFTGKTFMREMVKEKVPSFVLKQPKRGFTPPLLAYLRKPRNQPLVRELCEAALKTGALSSTLEDGLRERLKEKDVAIDDLVLKSLFFGLWAKNWYSSSR